MRLDWDAPLRELGNATPVRWLQDRYPDAPDNHVLASEMADLLGTTENLYERVRIKASAMGLHKNPEAREIGYRARGQPHPMPGRVPVHIFQDWKVCKWDRAIITSDWHIPYWNPEMARRMMLVAQNWRPEPITNLCIGGDFVDFGQISVFTPEEEETPRKIGDDLDHTEEIMNWLLGWFKDTVILKANHEARLARILEKQIGWGKIQRLVSTMQNFTWSNWSWCVIEDSWGNQWRVTHPGRRWKNLNRLAQELAVRYRMHLILAHSHVMSLGYDMSGRQITVDSGGMFDPRAVGYQIKTDAPYWAWIPGFLVLNEGKVHVFNDLWTDWQMYEDWLQVDLHTLEKNQVA